MKNLLAALLVALLLSLATIPAFADGNPLPPLPPPGRTHRTIQSPVFFDGNPLPPPLPPKGGGRGIQLYP